MNNEEDIFEDLDDEIVSSDAMEEQSNDVPSNSNNRNFKLPKNNNPTKIKNNLQSVKDYEKNNKGTIERLNNAKNKNRISGTTGIGKEIGNKLAGKSEEEKSNIEKGIDQIGGKATGAAITAATGGVIQGELAGELGDAAFQLIKKNYLTKVKIGVFISAAFISLIFIIIIAMNSDDIDYDESNNVTSYVTSNMTDEELFEYLKYANICPDKEILEKSGILDDIDEIIENDSEDLTVDTENIFGINNVCAYAISYFKRIRKTYNIFKETCIVGLTSKKNVDNPCGVTLNIPLLHETLSYGKANNELWNQKATPNQKKDIKDLSNAMVEYVHEYCYVDIGKYRDKNGNTKYGNCDGCTYLGPWYENREWYYFQLSFDKYVSFLKYGTTSSHPFYTGENNREVILGSTEKNTSINGQTGLYDHLCKGPSDDSFNYNEIVNSNKNNTGTTQTVCKEECSSKYTENTDAYRTCYNNCRNNSSSSTGITQKTCKEECSSKYTSGTAAYNTCYNKCRN